MLQKTFTHCFLLIFIFCMVACSSNTATTEKEKAPAKAGLENPLPALQEVLKGTIKVEYLITEAGITFETEGNKEVYRFFSYITNEDADEETCPELFDGNVVFKNIEGDIVQPVDFNFTNICNRAVFHLDGVRYAKKLSKESVPFFKQFLKMRQQVIDQNENGGGGH